MDQIGIFFGTDPGRNRLVAKQIAKQLGAEIGRGSGRERG